MGIYERFKDTINPDNRFTFDYKDETDTITPGGSCEHVFEFPFNYTPDMVVSCDIIYKQGIEVIKIVEIDPDRDVKNCPREFKSLVRVNLDPATTSLFKNNGLKVFAQAKLHMTSGEILYDEPHRIWIKEPLNMDDSNLYSPTFYLRLDEKHCAVKIQDRDSLEYIKEGSCSILGGHKYELTVDCEPGYFLSTLKINDIDISYPFFFEGSENMSIIAKAEGIYEK